MPLLAPPGKWEKDYHACERSSAEPNMCSWIPFEINRQGFRSDTAAVVLLIAGIILGFFILNATVQGSSRVVWAFARDQGFAFSGTLSIIDPRLDVPIWALVLNWSLLAALGFLILASSVGKYACHRGTRRIIHLPNRAPMGFEIPSFWTHR